jgi:hypothetical protein
MRAVALTIIGAQLLAISFLVGYISFEPRMITLVDIINNAGKPWQIVYENSQQEYVKDKYNCLNFSNDLVSKLKKAGYESEVVIGDTPEGRHAWVAVWVEPITGQVVQVDDYYKKDFNK